MKTALVTGASGNLGQEVIRKFITEGYNVVGTVIPNDPVPIELNSDRFEKAVADLMSEDDSQRLVLSVISKYGGVDAAILTVGGFAMGNMTETKTSDILKQYKLNFETTYNVARPVFIQMLKQNNGRIFLIGSRPGLEAKSGKGMIAYGLAKSLIFRLAELMNEEGKRHNVVTSVIVPSTIDTPQNRKSMPDADPNNWVKAEEIANTIFYYCSDASRSIENLSSRFMAIREVFPER
jgi:NAD(P)-dependent dehydrogenase (short-subunit alcohol dehydrogenase family)